MDLDRYRQHHLPFRKAMLWADAYDYSARKEFLISLPEYTIVEVAIGGFIGVEEE